MVYGDINEQRRRENKANQSQNKANRRALIGNPKQVGWVPNDRFQHI
jgi:hypothetical protein